MDYFTGPLHVLRAFFGTNPPAGRKRVPDQRDARFTAK